MKNLDIIDEYLDLVNDSDQVIGKKKRSEVYMENLSNFRVVNAFIFNSKGELWLPRRTAEKKLFPLCLDMSIGGHVESGESYENALLREAKEELNINLIPSQFRLLGHLSPFVHQVSSFMNVYEIKMDNIPNYNHNDFIDYMLLTPKELVERIDKGELAKSDLIKLIKIFYF